MALEITYLTASRQNANIAGAAISSETRTVSGTSAQSGVTPAGADFIKITATTAAARVEYSSVNPTATAASEYLGIDETIYRDAKPGYKVAGITA